MRCFLAIELPDRAVRAFESAGEMIRASDPRWTGEKWADGSVMHVTLKFLGELPQDDVRQIQTELGVLLPSQPSFPLTLEGLRAIPSPKHATMIWSAIGDPVGGCAVLAGLAERVAEGYGVPAETRRFTPHVTLVRARRPRSVDAADLDKAAHASGLDQIGTMSVLSASLFASTLTPHGPIHERLAEFVLGAGGDR